MDWIRLHVDAPPKPAFGAACNGCGVCCTLEPCPIGMIWSRRRHGACSALVWVEAEAASPGEGASRRDVPDADAGAVDGARASEGVDERPATPGHYRCGLLLRPSRRRHDRGAVQVSMAARWVDRILRRWIAAGQGCDCDVEAVPAVRWRREGSRD